ncbi:MAG: lipid A biosynthesis acyltransferase [Syntrophus sp. (in: bacteria)]|nr:lipid A biosynthesis acyltransferase [Syntrophus sp. (in: bacteria)]
MHKEPSAREDRPQWTSSSIGSSFQHNIFYFLIRYGGRGVSYALLNCVALYYTLFRPAIRKKADYYLIRRFKTKNPFKKLFHCYRIYVDLGKALIDRAAIGIRGPEYITITSNDLGGLFKLIHEGHGVILLTAHVGCWQAAMAQLRSLNTPVSLLLHREEGDLDLHYYEHTGVSKPFHIIDPLGYMGGVLEMMEVLKKGEVLSIMGDRVFGSDRKTASVNFLGGKVRLPFSAFKLASATGAPIVILFSHKSGTGSYEMTLDRVIRVPSHLGKSEKEFYPYVVQFAETLESYTERYPYQFFNFFDMWENSGRQ